MPVGRRFHYQLGGKGFILTRAEDGGRSWYRTGRSDTPGQRSQTDAEYGVLPDELDHPEVWNDWSGGFGHAYRETGQPTYHWGENFDGRWPNQLVHCQSPTKIAPLSSASIGRDIQWLINIPSQMGGSNVTPGIVAAGGFGLLSAFPTNPTGSIFVYGFVGHDGASGSRINVGRPVLVATGAMIPMVQSGFHEVFMSNPWAATSETISSHNYAAFTQTSDRTWISIIASGGTNPAVRSIIGDPLNSANLTATLSVGNPAYKINDMCSFNDQLAIGRPDGLFIGDQTGTFVNVVPWVSQSANDDNFRDLLPYGDGILAQTTQGMLYYRQNAYSAEVQEIPISVGRSPVSGYVRAIANVGPWVYAARWTGSGSYLLVTSDISRRENIRWHTLHHISGHNINRLFFDGITTATGNPIAKVAPHAYVATSLDSNPTSSAPLLSWSMPFNDDNPLMQSSTFSPNYIASAQIDLGAVDWDAPGTPKIFRSVEVWADSLLSGYRYGDIYYDVDQSGSFTLLGRANTSPKSTIYFPSGEGSFTTGQSIELRLASTSASPAFTPVYRSIVLRGALQPRSVDMITAVTRIADNMRDMQGAPMRSGATMLQELRDFGNPDSQGLQAHQLIDLAGATQWVKVLGRIEEREVWQQGEENPEIAATVRMAVLTYS